MTTIIMIQIHKRYFDHYHELYFLKKSSSVGSVESHKGGYFFCHFSFKGRGRIADDPYTNP